MLQKFSQIERLYSKQQIIPLQNVQQGKEALFIHLTTHKIFKGYSVKIKPHSYEKLFAFCQWRLQIQAQFPIVKLQAFQVKQENRDGLNLNYFIQYSSKAFQQINSLSLSQALYVMKSGLTAMEKLIEKFGFFRILPNMIMIGKNSIIKLWVNQHFEINQKQFPRNSQTQTISDLLEIIENRVHADQTSNLYLQQAKTRMKTIVRAQNYIQQFAFEHKIIIPPCLFPDKLRKRKSSDNVSIANLSLSNLNQLNRLNILNNRIFNVKQLNQTNQKDFCQFGLTKRMQCASAQTQSNIHSGQTRTQEILQQKERRWKKKPQNYQNSVKLLMSQKLMSKSKQMTMAQSTEIKGKQNAERLSLQDDESRNYRSLFNSSLKFQSSSNSSKDQIIQQNRKLVIMSTLNLKISCDRLSQQNNNALAMDINNPKHVRNNNRNSTMPPNCISILSGSELISPTYNQNWVQNKADKRQKFEQEQIYNSNKWIRKISHLFDQSKDLNQSVRVGDDEISYLNDIRLQKLQQFGRFISTSLLDIQEKEEECLQYR